MTGYGSLRMKQKINTVIIENVYPEIDDGRYAVKRTVGALFLVKADIISHGHDVIKALCKYRKQGEKKWQQVSMKLVDNDRWEASFLLNENSMYEYTFFAWRDPFLTWVFDLYKKHNACQDIKSDLLEGKRLIMNALNKAGKNDANFLNSVIQVIDRLENPSNTPDNLTTSNNISKKNNNFDHTNEPIRNLILGKELKNVMNRYPDCSDCGEYDRILKVFVGRREVEYSSWYEMWHRSQGKTEGKSANFDDMTERLHEIHKMGFNVIYLPPIHPVGYTNRKGPNNSLTCPPGSPGSLFAIGNREEGGHTAINPELGNFDDFGRFMSECHKLDMEVALDLALQISPDHPWVYEHPEWLYKRPDGTIKYAENPPKKYEDIYPLNFNTENKDSLYKEILKIVRFWMDKGVRIFRVDNPHTKPVFFWKWLIEEIHTSDPDVIFLAEAFTRPKIMKILAKAGFDQSYTYFTWRNYKQEFEDYLTELTRSETAEFMIGNFFTNTPDILPKVLQNAPPAAFKMRAVLASTLSSVWGIYNGFELCEGTPIPDSEEYLNSEKYQYKVWDWDRPGNIKEFIEKLNQIRKQNPALQLYRNLHFYKAEDNNILFYGKNTEDLKNIILVFVNLDPYNKHDSFIYVPINNFFIKPGETYDVTDLLTGQRFKWEGERNYISLDPIKEPAHIFHLNR